MKRAFVLAAALVTAAALNGTADAARWNGVIVAKDAKRKAVITVSPGPSGPFAHPTSSGTCVSVNAWPSKPAC